MGHSAIPILMALLSYFVLENVEVRTRQSESYNDGALNIFLYVFLNVDVTLGLNAVFFFVFFVNVDMQFARILILLTRTLI